MMKSTRMPVLFIGHGSPMNAIEDNEFSLIWRQIGASLPKPKAILSISAHWQTQNTAVTGAIHPETIHDFMGFPQELFNVEYPAQGSEWLISQIKQNLTPLEVDQKWGLDHGTWSVLRQMYPVADIPVVQLSLGLTHDLAAHYALGQVLKPLRDDGILILGSGNMVHNLRVARFEDIAFEWATQYDTQLKNWILHGDHDSIIHYERHGQAAASAINSEEHYLPLLYILGASESGEPVQFYCEKVTMGSISMRCVQIG